MDCCRGGGLSGVGWVEEGLSDVEPVTLSEMVRVKWSGVPWYWEEG